MQTEILLRRTRMHFPRFQALDVKISPIEKGGSDRRFYRVRSSPDQSLILVKYNTEREENRHYVEIAEFLDQNSVRVPKIYFHDPAEGLIWIEDMGERDLHSYSDESWMVRRALYESALDEILKLHRLGTDRIASIRPSLPVEFNAALYKWEQQYFFENCLQRFFGVPADQVTQLSNLAALNEIAEELSERPRCLVHRDFQSQNIIVRNGQACLIDFQGMRPGLPQYDVASLLYDPYVTFSADESAELLSYYCERSDVADDSFDRVLRLCAMQRLMQALGAYGFLGLVREQAAFLGYIPTAMTSLKAVIEDVRGLDPLRTLLQTVG